MECCGGDRNSLFCPGQFILVHLCLIVPAPEFGLFLDILRLLTKLCPSMHDTENSLEVPIIFFFWGVHWATQQPSFICYHLLFGQLLQLSRYEVGRGL